MREDGVAQNNDRAAQSQEIADWELQDAIRRRELEPLMAKYPTQFSTVIDLRTCDNYGHLTIGIPNEFCGKVILVEIKQIKP